MQHKNGNRICIFNFNPICNSCELSIYLELLRYLCFLNLPNKSSASMIKTIIIFHKIYPIMVCQIGRPNTFDIYPPYIVDQRFSILVISRPCISGYVSMARVSFAWHFLGFETKFSQYQTPLRRNIPFTKVSSVDKVGVIKWVYKDVNVALF